jgi:alkylated DNA nucleotide flippase Atl1
MPFDPDIASRFILAVPAGRWTTYGDVAEVGGDHDPMAAFRAGQWLANSDGMIDNYWRVIDVDGKVPDEFHGGGIGPRTAEEARAWLRREGVSLDANDRASKGRFHPWDWESGADTSQTAAATIGFYSSDLPMDIGDLQALAAIKLAPAQAVAVNLAILDRTPDDTRALTRLGRGQRALGLREDAVKAFARALSLDPKNDIARKHFLELAKELKPGPEPPQ